MGANPRFRPYQTWMSNQSSLAIAARRVCLGALLGLVACQGGGQANPPDSTRRTSGAARPRPPHCYFDYDPAPPGGQWPIVAEPHTESTAPDPTPAALSAVPASLRETARGCEAGEETPCRELADHYRASTSSATAATRLYARAADLARAQLPVEDQPQAVLLEPTAVTAAFRRAWFTDVAGSIQDEGLRQMADTLGACMRTDEQYAVRRLSRREAFRQVYQLTVELGGTFRSSLVAGEVADLGGSGWVWSVTFLGGTRRLPPGGAFAGYVDPATGELLVAFHWPEG